jgi:hypothetical protein
MANIHMLVGVGEGLATGLIVMAVLRARPGLVAGVVTQGSPGRHGFVAYGLLVSLGLAIFVAPFACPWPDGLEHVAKSLGFETQAGQPHTFAPFADYRFPFLSSATAATAAAGLIGTVVAFAAAYALARVLVPAMESPPQDATPGK